MSKKLSSEQINQELASKNRSVRLIGEYNGANTKSLFECLGCGNQWHTRPDTVRGGSGCPKCELASRRLTKDQINQELIFNNRTIRLSGDYLGDGIKTLFECLECGEQWHTKPNNVKNGSGCPVCSLGKLSKESVNRRLQKNGRSVKLVENYVNLKTKSLFECLECNSTWKSTPGNILAGRGCPSCSTSGFDPSKPSWVYVLKFAHFIKYGITNDVNRRLGEHLKNGEYLVIATQLYEDGKLALEMERHIKAKLGGKFTTPEICPDGWTETLCTSKLDDLLFEIFQDSRT